MNKLAFTITQAVALCPFGRSLLYEEIRKGRLPARKIGRRTFILRSDLERFLTEMPVIGEGAGAHRSGGDGAA
jgi:excisionase family DNA binding protein